VAPEIGSFVPRPDAWEKVLGKARYAADLRLEGMLHMKVLRSTRPHAKVLGLDISRAMEVPGVVRILTYRDIPGENSIGIIKKDQPVLAAERVRHLGEPIALVVAEDLRAAEQALEAIGVQYEDLPLVDTVEEAEKGEVLLHEGGNLLCERRIRRGDPEGGFAEADLIVERTYLTSMLEHTYLEPDAGVGWVDEDGRITICASTQNPHYDQREVARVLGLEPSRVRVIQASTGGGFGSKLDITVQCHLALAVYHLRRPVRLVYTREEAYLATAKRHPLMMRYRSGVRGDGRLVTVEVEIVGDTGAYASYGPAVATRAAVHAAGPYEVPNVQVRSRLYYTNHPFCGAMRGFGVPQIAFAHESQMDLLAQGLGLDPLEIRMRNALKPGSRTATGQVLSSSVGIGECLRRIEPHWREAHPKGERPWEFAGKGLGAMWYGIGNTGMKNPSRARVMVDGEGKVTLYTGAAEIGQGSDTVLCQIATAVLGVPWEELRLVRADTALTLDAGATSASRQTYISGGAVADACGKLRAMLLGEAARMLGRRPEKLTLSNGLIKGPDGEVLASLRDVAERCYQEGKVLAAEGFFDPETTPLDPETGQGIPYATYAFACQMAEVLIDGTTGQVQVKRVVAAHDVGRAINPRQVEGQIMSGVAMGVGFALMEEFHPGRTRSMKDYLIPTTMDMPEVVPIIVEEPEPTGPFGAKGVGEPALIPTAPAVLNAIADALGERIYRLPANLERVLEISRGRLGIP